MIHVLHPLGYGLHLLLLLMGKGVPSRKMLVDDAWDSHHQFHTQLGGENL